MDRMNDDVFIRLANETWHISVDHHGILFFFYPFVSIATRKSCGNRFRSSGTACVTPTPPDRWSGWAAAGSPCRTRRSRPECCSTRTDSWSAKSTPTVTAREVRHTSLIYTSRFKIYLNWQQQRRNSSFLFLFHAKFWPDPHEIARHHHKTVIRHLPVLHIAANINKYVKWIKLKE